jgi:hypothetical protein
LLDAYAQDFGVTQIDLLTDQMDEQIEDDLRERIDELRSVSSQQTVVKAYDSVRRQPLTKTIAFRVNDPPFPIDAKRHFSSF